MAYDGSITLISGITQANNGDFALVDASAVRIDDNTRLPAELDKKAPKASPVFTGSISLGRKTNTTIGTNSFAVGDAVTASSSYSHAEGDNTISSATSSHAEGSHTEARGVYCHAEGFFTIAKNPASHAEGSTTYAAADYAHAEGMRTAAYGQASHVEGYSITSAENYQHVSGKYNIPSDMDNAPEWTANTYYHLYAPCKKNNTYYVCKTDHTSENSFDSSKWFECGTNNTYAEIVGNGISPTNRSNARALDWNGDEYLKGDVYVQCSANSSNGKKLATEEYVDTQSMAMTYKGVVHSNSDLPAMHEKGWVYKVGTDGIYAGVECETGDTIICKSTGSVASDDDWDIVQTSDTTIIDDTAGAGDTTLTWSANKLVTEFNLKAPKESPVFTGSISLGNTTITEAQLIKVLALINSIEITE